jgi:hypothetical protein
MSDQNGVPLDELLAYIERAVRGDVNLHMQLLETMRRLANHPTAPPAERALGEVLVAVLLGERQPNLDKLPPEAAEDVRALLEKLKSNSKWG